MGLFGAMAASVAGLNVQGQAISVISDNLANTNTVGYKASRSLFSQLVTSSGTSGTEYNAGGVNTVTQRSQATQGSLNSGTSKTDLAITGNGYFRVADSKTNTTNTGYFYTRAGAFSEDKEGYLTNPDGFYLQGWRTDSDGNIASMQDLTNIELQSVGVSSQVTSQVSIGANLNDGASAVTALYDTSGTLANSLNNVLGSSDANIYLSDVRLYDAKGGARDVTIAFSKRAPNLWDYQIYTDGSNLQGGTAGAETRVSNGTIQFNTDGSLKNVRTETAPGVFAEGAATTINWSGGVDPSNVDFNFGSYTGGKIVTANANMAYADGVLDMAVENEAMPNGTYTVRLTGAGALSLVNAGGTVVATATVPADGNREVVFDNTATNTRVRLTLTDDFVETAGAYPDNTRTITIGSVSPKDKGVGSDGIVQKNSSFNTSFTNQNGFGAGLLTSIAIGEDGYVSGTFTNGETKKLYKVALAAFQNQAGLESVSGSLLRVTDLSGAALIKEPGNGGTGRVVSGALEGSTTDIANEFSQMIVAQRAFQANSSVIQTVDQMLNNLLQLR